MDDIRIPAEAFPVGEFVREELLARGWTEEQLVAQIGWTRDVLDALLAPSPPPITAEQARALALGFQTSHQFWLNLESQYRRWLARHLRSG